MSLWTPQLIPRTTFAAKRITLSYDSYNRPSEVEQAFLVENASTQPAKGSELLVLPEGLRDKVVYCIFTTTALNTIEEATTNAPDKVLIDGSWFIVQHSAKWNVGVQTHYKATCVKDG